MIPAASLLRISPVTAVSLSNLVAEPRYPRFFVGDELLGPLHLHLLNPPSILGLDKARTVWAWIGLCACGSTAKDLTEVNPHEELIEPPPFDT
jgi:hypothetical protein